MRARRRSGQARRWLTSATTAVALLLPLACGGGGGDGGGVNDGEVLFAGPAGELVPHPTGRAARFRVTATQDGASESSSFTATVTGNAPDGTFVTRYLSATGAVAEGTSRDSGDAIVVERFVNDPGGPAEETVVPDPPVGVVRTPVVAGDAIEGSFARTLELAIRIGDRVERRQALLSGSARRVPRERGAVAVAAGSYPDAIRYALSGTATTRLAVLGQSIEVRVEVAGDEWFAPGVGAVKEVLEVAVRAGDEHATIVFTTEREGAPGT